MSGYPLSRHRCEHFCWTCQVQLSDRVLFVAKHWETQRVIGFCEQKCFDTYLELISIWA
jgi:hypothetical protein